MRRVITALVSVGDRLVFLFGDPSVLRNVAPTDQPNDDVIVRLIERGQREGSFDPELSATWIEHSLFGLLLKGCEDAGSGEFPVTPSPRSSSARSNAVSARSTDPFK